MAQDGIAWTEDMDREVVLSPEKRGKFTELAAKFGISRTTVFRRATALNSWRPSWTPEQIEIVRVEWAKGTTAREIGEMINKSRNAVIGKAHRLRLDGRPVRNQHSPGAKKTKKETDPTETKAKKSRGIRAPVFYAAAVPITTKPPISIMELNLGTCRAIVGHGTDLLATYCGDDVFPGKVYCPGHCAIYYRPDNYRRRA